jgi:uncharacterized protein YjiS (DUF1127 family)
MPLRLRLMAGNLVCSVLTYRQRALQRRALQALDDRLLRDIGLTRAEVEIECAKLLWGPGRGFTGH